MDGPSCALLIVAAVVMMTDWWAVWSGRPAVEQAAKPAVMVALVALALTVDAEPSGVVPWMVAALACGLVGDVALLPTVDRFIIGLAAFLVGHVAYVIAFIIMWDPDAWLVVGAFGAAALLAAFGIPIVRSVRSSRLAGPVVVYIAVSAAVMVAGSGTGRWLAAVGVLAFGLSDGLLGHDRFVTPRPRGRVAVHVLYHLAQGALVVSTTLPP